MNRFWRDGSVGAIIKAENGNHYLAQKFGWQDCTKAGLRDPLGVVSLAWETYRDFWDRRNMGGELKRERGERELSGNLIKHFVKNYNEDLSEHHLNRH